MLNNTWDYMEKDFPLVTIPGSGHFVQQDASDLVSRSIKMWLNRRQPRNYERAFAILAVHRTVIGRYLVSRRFREPRQGAAPPGERSPTFA